MLPAARGRKPRSEGPGAAATPIAASPARRLANQTPVRSTNQKERWRAGAEERTERESGRRWEEGAGAGAWPRRGGARRGQSREGPRAPGATERKRKRIRGGKGKGKETPGNELVCSCAAHPRRLGSGVEAHLKYVLFFFGEPSLPEHSLRVPLALQEVGSAPLLHLGSGQPPPLNRAPYPGRGLCSLGARLRGLDWKE